MTSETMEYYLSNDTRLAPFEPVSKNNMLVYLIVELPSCVLCNAIFYNDGTDILYNGGTDILYNGGTDILYNGGTEFFYNGGTNILYNGICMFRTKIFCTMVLCTKHFIQCCFVQGHFV